MVRKKNLAPGTAYRVRMRARDRIDWNPFLPPAVVKARATVCLCFLNVGMSLQVDRSRSVCPKMARRPADPSQPSPHTCLDTGSTIPSPHLPPITTQNTKQTPVPNLQQMAAPRLEARGDGFVAVAWEPVEGAEK